MAAKKPSKQREKKHAKAPKTSQRALVALKKSSPEDWENIPGTARSKRLISNHSIKVARRQYDKRFRTGGESFEKFAKTNAALRQSGVLSTEYAPTASTVAKLAAYPDVFARNTRELRDAHPDWTDAKLAKRGKNAALSELHLSRATFERMQQPAGILGGRISEAEAWTKAVYNEWLLADSPSGKYTIQRIRPTPQGRSVLAKLANALRNGDYETLEKFNGVYIKDMNGKKWWPCTDFDKLIATEREFKRGGKSPYVVGSPEETLIDEAA